MRKGIFYVVIAIIAIGIIALNSIDSIKYSVCEDPDNVIVVVDHVYNEEVTITVDITSSAETFSDYVYHIEDGTLYFGVKWTMNPINTNATSRHTFTIETTETVTKIVLKGGVEEKIVYSE